MATQRFTFSSADCNFTPSACITLARLAVDIIGNDDFLSDAAQNSFVLDLVSAVGPSIAFDAISRQLWRINQYTPYGSGAYSYAYPPPLSGCPSTFLIANDISDSLQLSNEQQRTLAAFINARVSIADILVVCPYHVLMAFCSWLNAGNSNKVMSLDGSLQYNTSNPDVNGVYANTYDAQDYLGNAIYYYQLTSLVQTATGPIFDANYSATSIMSGFLLDTIYKTTNADYNGLVATLILAVNSSNPLRAGYGNISNAYDVTTTDGSTITRSANRNATKLTTVALGNYATYIVSNLPVTNYNNGISVISGKQLTNDNKQLITATGLTAKQFFDAYLLQGVASDISILKVSGYGVGEISRINTSGVAAFQVVSNYKSAGFSYPDIIIGLTLDSTQKKYEKIVFPLTLTDLSAISFLKNTLSIAAPAIHGITFGSPPVVKFNDARVYITAGFTYGETNGAFGVTTASEFYNTYSLSALNNNVDRISLIKNSKAGFTLSNIHGIPVLSNSATPRDFKEAGYTFVDVKTEFASQLSTASAFYTAFIASTTFSAYSPQQEVFILKSVGYGASGVYAITATGNRVYNSPANYSYTTSSPTDASLISNIGGSASIGDTSYPQSDINDIFQLNTAQGVRDVYILIDERISIYKIKNYLSGATVSNIKGVTIAGSPVSSFQIPSNYLGPQTVTINSSQVSIDGYTFREIKDAFSLTTASAFYNAFKNSTIFTNYTRSQQIFILGKMGYDISGVYLLTDASGSKIYPDVQEYSYRPTAGDISLKANVYGNNVPTTAETIYLTENVNSYFQLTTPQLIFDLLSLPNARSTIFTIKNRLPNVTVSAIRGIRDSSNNPLSAFQTPSNYAGSETVTGFNNEQITAGSETVTGFNNEQITAGFIDNDFNLLVGVTSTTTLPNFTYLHVTTTNGKNVLNKLQDLSAGYTAWRTLLKNSINQIKPQNQQISDLSGNDLKHAVYRVVYLSSVMNSDSSGTPFSPNTSNGLYAFFDLPSFISSYTDANTKPYDFLKPSEYLTYSSSANMTAASSNAKKIVSGSTTLITGQFYNSIATPGITFATYDGTNTIPVRYSLGKIDANTYHLNASSQSVNTNSARYFDSGYNILQAITLINPTSNKVTVIASSEWPIATSYSLLPLNDVVTYIQSSFFNAAQTMDDNISAAKLLPFSPNTWNFTNLMNGPVNSDTTVLNLDGVSWRQLTSAGAASDAITADLAANVNFITTPVTAAKSITMFNIPLANAVTVANKRNNTNDLIGRTTPNNKWTIAGIAGCTNYSTAQRRNQFVDGTGNVSALLAAQILDSETFVALRWSAAQLQPLVKKLDLADLLTAKEEITSEWFADYTSVNSTHYRMTYYTTIDRIGLVKLYYPSLSDASAQAIAVLTHKPDIIDAIAPLNLN